MSLLIRLLVALWVFRELGKRKPRPTSSGAPLQPKVGGLFGVHLVGLAGDSYAEGLLRPVHAELTKRGIGLTRSARVGAPTDEVASRARELVSANPGIDVLLLSTGANDGAQTPAKISAGELQAWATARGIRVLWLLPPRNARSAFSPALGQGWPTVYPPPMTLGDGQHPDAKGYARWSTQIVERLELEP